MIDWAMKHKRHKITGIPEVLTYLATTPKPIGLINKSTLHYMHRLGLVWIYTTPTGIKKAALSHTGLAAYAKMRGKG